MNGAGQKRRWLVLAGLTLLCLLLAWSAWYQPWRGGKGEIVYIGLAAPLSGTFAEVGLSMRRGVELAINEINKNKELGNIQLRLAIADDRSGLDGNNRAEEAARELASNNKLLAVIGHYFSAPTLAAAPIYQENRIPLIAPTATNPAVTGRFPGNFSIIPDDYYQSVFLANYVLYGLMRQKIAVIHSNTAYGRSLNDFFNRELTIQGSKALQVVEVDALQFRPEDLLPHMKNLAEAEIIFLAMNYTGAANIIKWLKDKGISADFIGGESMGGPHFIRNAGIYAENVYAVTPYLPNLLGESARLYEANFVQTYQTNPDWVATHSYEAVRLLASAIQQVGPVRTSVRQWLSKILREEDAIDSIGGPIYFDSHGSSRRPIAIGEVKGGRFVPARFQFTYVKYPELVKARKDSVRAFKMDGRFVKRTTVVFTGLHVNEIKSFDPVAGNFVADFLLWFRWDPDQNEKLNFEMTYGKVLAAAIREKYYDQATNNNFISYDVSAQLDGVFPLKEYPFDRQVLKIRIKPKVKNKEDLILVTDISDDSFLRKDLGLKAWKDIQHIQFTSEQESIWSYRNPKYNNKLFQMNNSQFNYHVLLERKTDQYIIKLLPLLVLVLLAYAMFFINFEFTASRFTVGVTTLLSSMSFHNVNKVDVGYLVRIDTFFTTTYYFIFFAIIETVLASALHIKGRKPLAAKVDAVAIVIYPLLMLTMAWFLFN
ncbi:ABC transporter substrate-binding protein [Candidatus Magnetaquicoccus inordinatus]|uniref:ABC transporter substrate-binding protein n=1 Tax=Candidatus Magnetaquicoccus inordinatus TaxID=2496818 RepID=UPI00102C8CCA|nr:ABC transporter substrate-binding protein [Candidatus Magnetaquicoccus inordinatus]